MKFPVIRKLNQSSILLCFLIAVIGLGIFAYLGFYNRYWADDWCFNTDFKHEGILNTVGNYFITGDAAHRGYPPNRYSFVILSGLFYLPGLLGTQILPALTILLWYGSLFWIGWNLNRLRFYTNNLILFSACALLLFYNLFLSPHRFQILYWRSGVFPYSWAIIFGLLILGLITSQSAKSFPSKNIVYMTAIVSFVGGGFSEIGGAFLFSGFTLLLLIAWFEKRRSKAWAVKAYPTILTAWVFLLAALITLAVSPSNTRYSDLNKSPTNPLLVPILSFQNAFDFIFYSIIGLPLPHIVLFSSLFGMGILSNTSKNAISDIRSSIRLIVLTLLITFLLVTAIQAPTTYLYNAPPDPRGQSLSRFVELAGLGIIAWAFGQITSKVVFEKVVFLPTILLLICFVYTTRATFNVYRELPGFVKRAQLWDARDSQIKSSIAQGNTQIEIKAIDTKDINTRDIIRSEDFGKWVSGACGVKYYDAQAMRVGP